MRWQFCGVYRQDCGLCLFCVRNYGFYIRSMFTKMIFHITKCLMTFSDLSEIMKNEVSNIC